jgi:uncharacterized protein (TIGR03435 family)
MTTDWVRCNVRVLLVVAWMTAGMPGVVLAQASAAVPNVAAAGDEHARGDIGGDWQGMLETNKSPRIVVKIARVEKGWSLKFYSIDQGAQLFNASRVAFDGSTLKFSIDPIGGSYEGKLRADGSSIAGNWTQGPSPLSLTLVRATKETAWEIPAPPPPAKMMAADANPSFDVATIKPNDSGNPRMQGLSVNGRNFATRNSSLEDLIAFAYDVQTKQIIGGPDWMDKDRFDVAGVPDVEGLPNVNQLKIMLQKLLADRWKLTFHHDKKELSAFVLSVGKSGQKLPPTQSSGVWPTFGVGSVPGGATLIAQNATTMDFTIFLQLVVLDRPVVDRTGISGRYDMTFKFTPDDSLFNGHPPKAGSPTDGAETLPGFFEGIQRLGLKLEAEKTPVDVIVVDRAERYSAN